MTTPSSDLQHEGLKIAVEDSSAEVVISWHGISDARDPGAFLNPFMTSLCTRLKGKRVTMRFNQFEYMNSATVGPIINFVRALDANEIPTLVVYNQAVDWQRLNFQLLAVIANTLKNLTVEGI